MQMTLGKIECFFFFFRKGVLAMVDLSSNLASSPTCNSKQMSISGKTSLAITIAKKTQLVKLTQLLRNPPFLELPHARFPRRTCPPSNQFLCCVTLTFVTNKANCVIGTSLACHREKSRVFLNPWFGEPVVCTLDSRGFRHFRGFRDFRESSTQLLVFSCPRCLRRFRRFRDFRRFRERRPAHKP